MATLTISTADNSITDTEVGSSSGLLNSDDGSVGIDSVLVGGVTIPEGAKPLYSTTGVPIYSVSSVPVYESVIEEEDDLDGYTVVDQVGILITGEVNTPGASGISVPPYVRAYWSDYSTYPIGNNISKGSLGDPDYRMRGTWNSYQFSGTRQDILLLVSSTYRNTHESSPYNFKVHLLYQESRWSNYTSISGTVTVLINGSIILTKTITPSYDSNRQAATTSDNYVTITFSSDGTPTAIA